jgi:hypothetical protein
MTEPERYFVIPTHRLRDVGVTIHEYDEHFWRNGHSLQMIVFDDSTQANVEKYLPLFEQTKTRSDLYYVGPREKEQFIEYLNARLRNKRLEPLVRNIFRPSYGGNRNFSLMYSLGGHMVSSDDDMRPYSLMEDSPESLENSEISRGRLHKLGKSNYMRNPPASEILNEEIANFLKRKIHSSMTSCDELGISFEYSGEVTAQDAEEILAKITALHRRALLAAENAKKQERIDSLRMSATNLEKAFYGFEPDFFQHNLVRIVDDVIGVIKSTLELWPTLVEICYFQKLRHGLPTKQIA